MRNGLKDLVWKGIEQDQIEKDKSKQRARERFYLEFIGRSKENIIYTDFLDFYCPMLRNELDEINNKAIEYTKDDMIGMFIDAGFVWVDTNKYSYKVNDYSLDIHLGSNSLDIRMDGYFGLGVENVPFNVPTRIDFYYNKFREILEFEQKKKGI
jgi:hypothetical protein